MEINGLVDIQGLTISKWLRSLRVVIKLNCVLMFYEEKCLPHLTCKAHGAGTQKTIDDQETSEVKSSFVISLQGLGIFQEVRENLQS